MIPVHTNTYLLRLNHLMKNNYPYYNPTQLYHLIKSAASFMILPFSVSSLLLSSHLYSNELEVSLKYMTSSQPFIFAITIESP